MANIYIVKTTWSGTSGGPGLTQLAVKTATGGVIDAPTAQSVVNAVKNFWTALNGILPTDVTLTVLPQIDAYDSGTNQLVGTSTAATAPTAVVGLSSQTYAGGVGVKLDWQTGGIVAGRRIRGHTYIVPIQSGAFDTNGLVTSGTITTVTNAGTSLISALSTAGAKLQVWSRARTGLKPRTGFYNEVQNCAMTNKSAILRGRRD